MAERKPDFVRESYKRVEGVLQKAAQNVLFNVTLHSEQGTFRRGK